MKFNIGDVITLGGTKPVLWEIDKFEIRNGIPLVRLRRELKPWETIKHTTKWEDVSYVEANGCKR